MVGCGGTPTATPNIEATITARVQAALAAHTPIPTLTPDFNRAIELDPNNALGYNNRDLAYGKLGQHDLATKDKKRACELDKTFC